MATSALQLLRQARVFLDLIRFEHTVFALPFAYSGMILGTDGSPSWPQVLWVSVAMASARTAAMAFNRLIDRHLDARNPRTADRPIQKGLIGADTVRFYAILSLLVLGVAASQLNTLTLQLFPLALLFLVGYSYTKRFTWTCHYVLGFTDALAPMGAWVAVTGSIATTSDLPAWWLSGGVMLWIAGFDILYSLQDLKVDREQGLYSIPARFGARPALWTARLSHLAAAALFAATGWAADFHPLYWVGWGAVVALLGYEHTLIDEADLSRIDLAFFTVNSAISLTLFTAILVGVYL